MCTYFPEFDGITVLISWGDGVAQAVFRVVVEVRGVA